MLGDLGDDAKMLEEMPSRIVLWELGDSFPVDRTAVCDVSSEFVEGIFVLVHLGVESTSPLDGPRKLIVHRFDQVLDCARDQHPGGIRARFSQRQRHFLIALLQFESSNDGLTLHRA